MTKRVHSRRSFSSLLWPSALKTSLSSGRSLEQRRLLSIEPLEARRLLAAHDGANTFPTIHGAINAANPGDTITIDAGTYNEQVNVDKQVNLQGAGSGNNSAVDTIIDAGGSGNGLTIAASGASLGNHLTIENLRVQNGANGVYFNSAVSHVTLNNVASVSNTGYGVENANSAVVSDLLLNNVTSTGNQIGYRVSTTGSVDGLTITNSTFDNNVEGLYTNATNSLTTNETRFNNISISNTSFNNDSLKGIYAESLNNATFDGITVNNSGTSGASSAGIDINLKFGNYSNITIENSSITNSGTGDAVSGVGVTFKARADGPTYSLNPATLVGVTLSNNIISGNENGVRAGESDDLTNNPTNVVIRYNDLSGNLGVALDNQTPNVIDASRNWWGNMSGPTIASNVGGGGATILETSGAVTYRPWLIYSPDATPAIPGVQLLTTVTVTSQTDVSAAVNDFTLLQNAIGAAAAGQTIDLSGAFNWTATNSAAAYAASTNTAPTADIRGVALPDGVNNLTITSSALNATITGGGDSTDGIYNSFLFSAVASPAGLGNNNLAVTDLNIDNFKSGVMLGWNNGGMFNGTFIQGDTITVAADNDNNVNDTQGIAVYFWNGQNQTMTGNTINFEGNGTRSVGTGARSYGFQDGTTGGTGYNGLSIDHNIFQLLPSAVGGSEVVTGIWENGHNDDNASHISIADNEFLGIQGQRLFDIGVQLSSQTTNMAVDGNTFTDVKYVYWVGTHNGDAPGDQFTFTNNVLTRVGDANGVFLQNRIDNVLPADVITINWATNNTIDGFTGIRGLNELSTQATGHSRPTGGASDLDAVVAFGPIPTDYVNNNWGAQARFTNPLAAPGGTPGPIAFGFNTFNTIQAGVNAVDSGGTTNVLAGTYAENVTINRNLTLTGLDTTSPPTAIIQPAAGDGITIVAPATSVTVENLEVTGAANGVNAIGVQGVTLNNLLLDANATGFTASNLIALNLADLTLTGNTTAGGTINNTLTVNDTPTTGATGATDTITGSSFQRNSDDAVSYSGVVNLNVTGGTGSDTFNVTPGVTTISVDGDLPNPPTTPGDTLNVVLAGLTTPALTDTVTATGHQGSWTFGNAMPVNFNRIETLSNNTDLSITKTDDSSPAGSVQPGTALTYTIVVTNAGSNGVTGATVVDTFPVDFTGTYTAASTGGATGFTASGNGDINDTVNLPAGATITYTSSGTVNAAATGSLSNTATVTAPANTLDTNIANNTATDTDTLVPTADLQITKTDNSPGPGQAVRGSTLTYTIVVTNAGPSDALGASVDDTLPAAFTGGTFTATATGGATGFTAAGAGNISDTVNLPAGSTITYVVTGIVNPAATGTLSNTATVTPAGVTDPNLANNSATDSDILAVQADLEITKTDNSATPGSIVPGTSVTYTITVTNTGPSAVTGASVVDTFPAGFTGASYTSVDTGGAVSTAGSGNGNINDTVDLPVGATITYTVMGTVGSAATGTLANTATITAPADVFDNSTANNTATDTLTLTPQAHLVVTKTDNSATPGSAVPGTSLTYTITVTNSGPSVATATSITDALPAGFTGATFTSVAAGGATGNTASGSGNISDTVTLPSGGSVVYTVTGTISAAATGSFANTATVAPGAGVTDTNPTTSVTDTLNLTPEADLSITKTDGKTNVIAGTSDTYTIVVTNLGPNPVSGAMVTDTFPADFTGATFTATATGGATGFTASGSGNLSETVNLPVGGTITYVVTGTISASATGTLTNSATVAAPAGVTDSTASNNTATDTDTITAQSAPTITSANTADFAEGSSNTFTVTATGVPTPTLTETGALPSGVTFVDNGDGTATLTGTPAAGTHGNYTLTITAHNGVGSDATQSFTLTVSPATVQGSGFGYLAGVPGDGSIQTFVQNLYRELLGREPDATGSAFWVNYLQQHDNAAGRLQVISGFMNSEEYKEHYITTLYQVLLGRGPDAGGLQYWAGQMGNPGTPGGHSGSSDEKIIVSQFIGSDEFYADAGGTPQGFAQALYQDLLGRTGEASGVAAWAALAQAQPNHRDAVVRFFLSTPEAEHLLLDSFYPAPGGTASHPLPAPGNGVASGSYDLAVITGDGWENLYLQGPFDSSPQGNDAFFAELDSGVSWDDVQLHILATDQFYNNPNRPTTL
jgi:uncharacterized repeat protein (TIGR01451 family)